MKTFFSQTQVLKIKLKIRESFQGHANIYKNTAAAANSQCAGSGLKASRRSNLLRWYFGI
jgi:hypothetical protein